MRNHWLVGAREDGNVDRTAEFVEGGFWKSFVPEDKKLDSERKLWSEAEPGDRIGIKRRLGNAGDGIKVTTTGTITSIDRDAKRLSVDWTEAEMENVVESRGCMATVCGPYGERERAWLAECFPEVDEEADWADLLASAFVPDTSDAREDPDATRLEGLVHEAR